MSSGPLNSAMMGFVAGFALDNDPSKLAFSIRNANKDVGYYSRMVEDLGVDSMVSVGTRQSLSTATEQGHGDDMVSQMYTFFTKQYQ